MHVHNLLFLLQIIIIKSITACCKNNALIHKSYNVNSILLLLLLLKLKLVNRYYLSTAATVTVHTVAVFVNNSVIAINNGPMTIIILCLLLQLKAVLY